MTIRTYIPRRGRVSKRQAAAIAETDGLLLPAGDEVRDLGEIFGGLPVVLEIGFGTGSATVTMAAADLELVDRGSFIAGNWTILGPRDYSAKPLR